MKKSTEKAIAYLYIFCYTLSMQALNKLPARAVYDWFDSPIGQLALFASNGALYLILWPNQIQQTTQQIKTFSHSTNNTILIKTKKQLDEYFSGNRKVFDIPLAPQGTIFQQQAWQQLQNIPYGETISYGEQARRLGDKNKARAVGTANGANPISIIIPCHRVIGCNGKLTGFGGGLDTKAFLLRLEQA